MPQLSDTHPKHTSHSQAYYHAATEKNKQACVKVVKEWTYGNFKKSFAKVTQILQQNLNSAICIKYGNMCFSFVFKHILLWFSPKETRSYSGPTAGPARWDCSSRLLVMASCPETTPHTHSWAPGVLSVLLNTVELFAPNLRLTGRQWTATTEKYSVAAWHSHF